MQCSSCSGDKQWWVVPKIVGSIPPCVRTLLLFHAVYRGKIPEVLKTAEARHVFIPFSHGKYFPVVDLCRPASSCVCTGISLSVLLQCSPNFHIHVSVSDFYIPTMDLPILLHEICGLILGIYKLLTDTWMWKLKLRPCHSFSGNT